MARWCQARPVLEPSCTAPCTGISAATGTNRPISASIAMPPPTPKAAVSAEVKKLATTRSAATHGADAVRQQGGNRIHARPAGSGFASCA